MDDHQKALQWALVHVGQHEEPIGSNTGPFVRLCQACTFLAGTGWPWCAAFFCAAWKIGANRPLPYPTASAYGFADWSRAHWGLDRQPLPGDGVVFRVGAGHIAMIKEQLPDGRIVAVGGNQHDSVSIETWDAKDVYGYVRVPADQKPLPAAATKPPLIVTATSLSGRSQTHLVAQGPPPVEYTLKAAGALIQAGYRTFQKAR